MSNYNTNVHVHGEVMKQMSHENNVKLAIEYMESEKRCKDKIADFEDYITHPSPPLEALIRIYKNVANGNLDNAISVAKNDLINIKAEIRQMCVSYPVE